MQTIFSFTLYKRVAFFLIFVSLVLVSVFVDFGYSFANLIILFVAVIAMILVFAPPLTLRIGGTIEADHDQQLTAEQKVDRMIVSAQNAKDRIYILAGEFNPAVFDNLDLVQALIDAADHGVDVRIITGDKEKSLPDFIEELDQNNANFMSKIKPYLKKNLIKMYVGPREVNHYHIFDNDIIVEKNHRPEQYSTWSFADNTWFIANKKSKEFVEKTSNRNFTDLSSLLAN